MFKFNFNQEESTDENDTKGEVFSKNTREIICFAYLCKHF